MNARAAKKQNVYSLLSRIYSRKPACSAGFLVVLVAAELGFEPRQYESESYTISFEN